MVAREVPTGHLARQHLRATTVEGWGSTPRMQRVVRAAIAAAGGSDAVGRVSRPMTPTPTASPPFTDRIAEDAAGRHLLAAAQLAAGSIAFGAGAALLAWLVGLAAPMFFFLAPPVWLVLPPAAAAGGAAAGAALGVGRALGWAVVRERVVVPLVAGVLSLPPLFALAAVFGARALDLWWLWVLAAVGASWAAHRRLLRHPLDDWRPVLVRLLFSLGLALGALAGLLVVYVGFWSSWWGGSPAQARGMPWLIGLLGVAGMLGSRGARRLGRPVPHPYRGRADVGGVRPARGVARGGHARRGGAVRVVGCRGARRRSRS